MYHFWDDGIKPDLVLTKITISTSGQKDQKTAGDKMSSPVYYKTVVSGCCT